MRLKIELTRECIDEGRRRDCHRCPVARALRNAGATKINVGGNGDTRFTYRGQRYVTNDYRIKNFIYIFDAKELKMAKGYPFKTYLVPKFDRKEFKPRTWVLNCRVLENE